jgi:hypothetical protein
MGVIWESSFGVFLLVTVFLGGGAAWMTGRAVAQTWRPLLQLVAYIVALCCVTRFIHYALFGETLLSLHYFLADLVALAILGGLGFQTTKATQMVTQYDWLYQRSGPVSWRKKG